MLSQTEENYLKSIYHLEASQTKSVSTTLISKSLNTKASSVTDMLGKLADKKLVNYKKYKGVNLTSKGKNIAVKIIRKHRLWEVFLVEKLNFNWDEVHEIAEQLEHIKSDELIEKLDTFLNFPTKDPHGDPIPDAKGNIRNKKSILLSNAKKNVLYTISCVKDNSKALLQFLDKHALTIESELTVVDKLDFDESITAKLSNGNTLTLSNKICTNVFVTIK
ncbi:metal-dependent transcriptional regulator [Lutibacter sp. TH_r2]|uniref:metal-dependent transcriptional regulator n=1 Tax=Lutibacter sp. TH_r2 TaxID=3082083 RepID=UPI002954C0B2|nr:metal-dependent transcriptional regulator [Lutibacter sp. TH_r2]MDV7186311.1 metal-dependent transcriptional regulator [Lutibacter sp. TH_r2]